MKEAMSNFTNHIRRALSSAHSDIAALRTAIEDTKTALEDAEAAPMPMEDALARFDVVMAERRKAAAEAAGVYALASRTSHPGAFKPVLLWESNQHQNETVIAGALFDIAPDVMRENVRKRLEDFYATSSVPAMTDAERNKCLKELRAKLRDLEKREEAIILQAEEAGLGIERRSDIDPAVFLEIEGSR